MHKTSRRHTSWVISSLMLLALLSTFLAAEPVSAKGYLIPQRAALRAPFRHHLLAVAEVPYYHISATVDPQNTTVDGELSLRYTNTTARSLSELVFRLLPNATTIYGAGSLAVEAVTQGSKALEFELSEDRTVMRVQLLQRLAPGDRVSIDIAFVTTLPIDDHHGYGILNQTSRITSLAGWYPILAVFEDGWLTPDIPAVGDAMVAETSLYEVTLIVPAGTNVASTGRVTGVDKTGSKATWHLVSGPAREFAAAISEEFELHQTQVEGVTVRFHALPASRARTSSDAALVTIANVFRVYANQFGPYPFTEFDVVEAPISIGGYEFPGMVYVDDGLRVRGDPVDYRYIIAHEVAHQWWYGLVGNDFINEPWLDESLASYSASIYLEQAEGKNAGDALLAYWRRTYGPRKAHESPVNSSALGFSSWLTYRSPVYYQGALFLDALREEIGDETFSLVLKRYLTTYRYQSATTEDFLELAETVSCRDLDPLFKQWFAFDSSTAPDQCALRLPGESHLNRPL